MYLHRFDVWLRDQGDCWHDKSVIKFCESKHRKYNLEGTNLKVGSHVRYADDILVLCKDYQDAVRFRYSVTHYLTHNMRLEINEEKTKIYDLTKEKMKYLGYDFYVLKRPNKNVQRQNVYTVNNTLPKVKENEIVDKCGELLRAIKKRLCFENIHNWNVYVVGLHNYYKGMTHFSRSFKKIGWRIRKLFYHTMDTKVKFTLEQSYKNGFQGGRYSSWGKKGYYCFLTYPVIGINWANWDSGLISHMKIKIRDNPYHYGEKKHKPGVSLEDIGYLVNTSKYIKSSRLAMFRISKYSSVKGISYLSGEYVPVVEYHCHHIKPIEKGGTHDFDNLCVISENEYTILHSTTPELLYTIYPRKRKRIKLLIDALQVKT